MKMKIRNGKKRTTRFAISQTILLNPQNIDMPEYTYACQAILPANGLYFFFKKKKTM